MAGKLKPLDVERETRPGKYPDGDGLYLVVASPTSKNWSYRYWKDAKQRWLGPGSPKDVSLKDARLAGDAARLRVKGDRSTPGVDIVQEKRTAARMRKPSRSRPLCPPSRNVPKPTFASTGRPGARSIAINGRRCSNPLTDGQKFSNPARLAGVRKLLAQQIPHLVNIKHLTS
jgi:hypothetical protein